MDSINTSTAVHRLGKVVRRLREKDPGRLCCKEWWVAACCSLWPEHCITLAGSCYWPRPPAAASGSQVMLLPTQAHRPAHLAACLQGCPSGWCRMSSTSGWWHGWSGWRRARLRSAPRATALAGWPTRCGDWQVRPPVPARTGARSVRGCQGVAGPSHWLCPISASYVLLTCQPGGPPPRGRVLTHLCTRHPLSARSAG